LQRGDGVEFVLGQQTGVDLVDAGRGGHGVGDLGGVAGEHDDGAHARVVQAVDHRCGIGPQSVGDGNDACDGVVDGDDHRCLPGGGEFFGDAGCLEGVRQVVVLQQRGVADQDPVLAGGGGDALAGHGLGVVGEPDRGDAGVGRGVQDRAGEGVFGAGLGERGPSQDAGAVEGWIEHDDVGELGSAFGEGPGLIDRNGVDLG